MSTIAKLDKNVRLQRTQRKDARNFYMRNSNISTTLGMVCIAAYAKMVELQKASHRTGASKQRTAALVLAEFQANLPPEAHTQEISNVE